MTILILIFLAWIVCGVVSYGGSWAYWDWMNKNEWPILKYTTRNQAPLILLVTVSGPLGLVVSLFASNFFQKGWKLGSLR